MSHFVAYILQFQEIIVYKIPPGGGGGSIASLRSINPKFKLLGIFCGCTTQFVSNRVGNPEYRISRDAAHVWMCI